MPNNQGDLKQRAEQFFTQALAKAAPYPVLASLHRTLAQGRQQLDQPMRVAIVGLIKAGKSTLMNGLLGEDIAATGATEATFNVNWLLGGEERSLLVHYKDGRPPEAQPYAALKSLTLRTPEHMRTLTKIKYIQVFHPNPILKRFHLIDTPGLCSHFGQDSQNTEEFLRIYGDEMTRATQQEAADADAVLYLFSQGMATADQEALTGFLGSLSGTTPINAIGVLTKVDSYWSDMDDPMEGAARIEQRLLSRPDVRGLLYAIKPVCGLLAQGAQSLTPGEFATLSHLAKLPPETLEGLVRNINRLREKEYPDKPDIPPALSRRAVADRVGQYGVWLACRLLREADLDRAGLSAALLERSGLSVLLGLIESHFGNRAFLIKLGKALRDVEAACFHERGQTGPERQAVEEIAGEREALEATEHAFSELRVLRLHYEGRLTFTPDEVQQLLAVTGEFGRGIAPRLGVKEDTDLDTLAAKAEARVIAWNRRANDFMGGDGTTVSAASVLVRSYERILNRVRTARQALTL